MSLVRPFATRQLLKECGLTGGTMNKDAYVNLITERPQPCQRVLGLGVYRLLCAVLILADILYGIIRRATSCDNIATVCWDDQPILSVVFWFAFHTNMVLLCDFAYFLVAGVKTITSKHKSMEVATMKSSERALCWLYVLCCTHSMQVGVSFWVMVAPFTSAVFEFENIFPHGIVMVLLVADLLMCNFVFKIVHCFIVMASLLAAAGWCNAWSLVAGQLLYPTQAQWWLQVLYMLTGIVTTLLLHKLCRWRERLSMESIPSSDADERAKLNV